MLFLGVLGADVKGFHLPCEDQPITSRMAMICGTSTCHMAVSGLRFWLCLSNVAGTLFLCVIKNIELHDDLSDTFVRMSVHD